MAGGSLTAEWVLALATIASALLAGVFSLLVPLIKRTARMERTIRVIHTVTNQQLTDSRRYQLFLEGLLKSHGIEIPVDQSDPVLGHADAEPGQPTKADLP